ncbi:MAG: Fur family transcriptional regulator [Bacillota bacterium]
MERTIEVLKGCGLKATSQRMAILDVILASEEPISAESIFMTLQPQQPELSLSTVYRNLNLLVDKSVLVRLQLADERSHYRFVGSGHQHHLVCLGCNRVVELEQCPIHQFETDLMKDTQFRITQHRLTFYGYCPRCEGKK